LRDKQNGIGRPRRDGGRRREQDQRDSTFRFQLWIISNIHSAHKQKYSSDTPECKRIGLLLREAVVKEQADPAKVGKDNYNFLILCHNIEVCARPALQEPSAMS
jgi:hypothetical protein